MPFSESSVARNALVILAVIAAGATLYALAGILTPLALEMITNSYFNGEDVRLDGAIRMAPR